jgi:hypothetical protein
MQQTGDNTMGKFAANITQHGFGEPGARASMRELNRNAEIKMPAQPYAHLKPEFYVGIFNVSRKEIRIPRDWAVGGNVIIPAREEEDLYSKPYVLKAIEGIMHLPPGSVQMVVEPINGEALAQDVVNTSNPGGDWKTYRQWTKNQEDIMGAVGNNYYEKGLFWCRLETPTSDPDMEAVEFAMGCLEKNYNNLITEANLLYSSGPREQLKICAPHHEAADYFIKAGNDVELPWHQILQGNFKSKLKKKIAAAMKNEMEKKEDIK